MVAALAIAVKYRNYWSNSFAVVLAFAMRNREHWRPVVPTPGPSFYRVYSKTLALNFSLAPLSILCITCCI